MTTSTPQPEPPNDAGKVITNEDLYKLVVEQFEDVATRDYVKDAIKPLQASLSETKRVAMAAAAEAAEAKAKVDTLDTELRRLVDTMQSAIDRLQGVADTLLRQKNDDIAELKNGLSTQGQQLASLSATASNNAGRTARLTEIVIGNDGTSGAMSRISTLEGEMLKMASAVSSLTSGLEPVTTYIQSEIKRRARRKQLISKTLGVMLNKRVIGATLAALIGGGGLAVLADIINNLIN